MGSSLSIHNNTNDTIYVKIGDDEAAIRIGTIISSSIAAVVGAIATAGVGVAAVSGGLVTITVAPALSALGAVSALASATSTVVMGIRDELHREGYTALEPGETHQGPKKTLSLWQQCHVIRTREASGKVYQEHTYMRPIFTGPTDGSCLQHDVAYWVNKYPYEPMKTYSVSIPQSAPARARAPSARPGRSVFIRGRNEHTLYAGERLDHDEYIVAEHFKLIQQSDGNLVLYHHQKAVWANNCCNKPVAYTIMQHDGNLVSYTADHRPLWASNTCGWHGAMLLLRYVGLLGIAQIYPVRIAWECHNRSGQLCSNLASWGYR